MATPIKGPDGKEYRSISALAKAYGVKTTMVCRKLRKDISIEDIVDKSKIRARPDRAIKGPDGKEYASMAELAKAYDVNVNTFYYKYKKGIPVEDIIDKAKARQNIKGPDGKKYHSIAALANEIAKMHDISKSTVRYKLRKGISPEDIIRGIKPCQSIKGLNGEEYETIAELAKAYGVKAGTLASRLRQGMPLEKALTPSVKTKRIKGPDGKEYESVTELAKAYNVSTNTLSYRLKKGMPIEEALMPVKSQCIKGPDGEEYENVAELAKSYNINSSTLGQRLRRGMPLEQALINPGTDDPFGNHFASRRALLNYYMINTRCGLQDYKSDISMKRIYDTLKNRSISVNGHTIKITNVMAPYLEIEADNERFMVHLDKMLKTYHNSSEFNPLFGIGRVKSKISETKLVEFPYYDITINGISKRISYWDLMQEELKI